MRFSLLCACGKRLGLHRFGDNACPNPRWRGGNGQPQWLQSYFSLPAGAYSEGDLRGASS